MQRKVIQLAGKTLVVSLPHVWVKKQNVRKGDAIFVEEKGNKLLLQPTETGAEQKIVLDVSGLNSSLVWRYLVTSYVAGFTEIELRFESSEIMNPRTKKAVNTSAFIGATVTSLIGMEIVRVGQSFCIVKEVSMPKKEEFDGVFRRLFLNVLLLADECVAVLKNNGGREGHWFVLEENINRLTHFCLRLINKNIFSNTRDAFAYADVVNSLECIGDEYSSLISSKREKRDKNGWPILEASVVLVRNFYAVFYDFDKQKYVTVYKVSRDIQEQIESKKTKSDWSECQVRKIVDSVLHGLNARIMLAL